MPKSRAPLVATYLAAAKYASNCCDDKPAQPQASAVLFLSSSSDQQRGRKQRVSQPEQRFQQATIDTSSAATIAASAAATILQCAVVPVDASCFEPSVKCVCCGSRESSNASKPHGKLSVRNAYRC